MALVVKNLLANAEDIRDVGSVPGWGRSPGEENDNPVTEEPGGAIVHRGWKPESDMT